MAQIIDIRRVEVGPKSLTARVRVAIGAPLMTSEDLEGTTRVYRLLPHIIDHVCLGDAGETFKDVMGDTELAHLLEHVTVELLAQSDIAGDTPCGRTWEVEDERRTYDVEFPCPDDVLVAGALSSAVWILQWAYSGGGEPEPDVDATVRGLVGLVQSLPEPEPVPQSVREYVVFGDEAAALVAELGDEEEQAAAEAVEVEEPLELEEAEDAEAEQAVEVEPVEEEPEVEEIPVPVDPWEVIAADALAAQIKESPEARQASQDVPAEYVEPVHVEPTDAEVDEVLDLVHEAARAHEDVVEDAASQVDRDTEASLVASAYAFASDAEAAAAAAEALPWDEDEPTADEEAALGASLADDAFDGWEDVPTPDFMR